MTQPGQVLLVGIQSSPEFWVTVCILVPSLPPESGLLGHITHCPQNKAEGSQLCPLSHTPNLVNAQSLQQLPFMPT